MWHLEKIPKVANFYWGNDTLSFLRYLTIFSFKKYNPDWKIKIYQPKIKFQGKKTWKTPERYNSYTTEKNYLDQLLNLDVELIEVNFNDLGFTNNLPETFKADFLRWKTLSTQGGLWSDFDIIYFKPLENLFFNDKKNKDIDTVISLNGNLHSIGFLLASPENDLFKYISKQVSQYFNPANYQSIGSIILNTQFPSIEKIEKKFKYLNIFNIKTDVVYPLYDDYSVPCIFTSSGLFCLNKKTIGLHWYGGHPDSGKWENLLTENNFRRYNNILCQIIGKVKKKKYTIVCISKIYNELRKDNLKRFVKYIKPLVDGLVIYDNRSTDGSYEFILNYTPHVIRGLKNHFANDRAQQQLMLNEALKLSPDFILWLDADEVMTANTVYNLQELCAYCEENQLDGIGFHELNIWRSNSWQRTDNLYNEVWFVRLWRVTPKQLKPNKQKAIPDTIKLERVKFVEDPQILNYGFSSEKRLAFKYLINKTHVQEQDNQEMLNLLINEKQLKVKQIPKELFPQGLWNNDKAPEKLSPKESLAYIEKYRQEVLKPSFSIICPIYNNLDWLKFIYKQVLNYTNMSDKEFFFVIGTNVDNTVLSYLSNNSIPHYIMEKTTQNNWNSNNICHKYNFGASKAQGDFLIFLYPDIALSRNWFKNLWKAYNGSNCISPRLVEANRDPSKQYKINQDFGEDYNSYQESKFQKFAASIAAPEVKKGGIFIPLLIRKEHFNLTNGFFPEDNITSISNSDIFQAVLINSKRLLKTDYQTLISELANKGIIHQTSFDSLVYNFQNEKPVTTKIITDLIKN